jgi:ferredoxin
MADGATSNLPVGAWVWIEKPRLQELIDRLQQQGYRTIGPRVEQAAVVYGEIDSVSQIPLGMLDEQDAGRYRLREDEGAGYFDHVIGPHSLKNYTFVPRETLQELRREDGAWHASPPPDPGSPVAVIGVRSCDLHALAIQDRIFLEGPYVDPAYQSRRERLFLVAVNCRRAAATCFCHSMGTGPAVQTPHDLALTELDDRFVIEVGSDRGGNILSGVDCTPCTQAEIDAARDVPRQLERAMHARSAAPPAADAPRQRSLDTDGIRDLLMGNLTHPRWQVVAERCLSCTNCTLVCPTCFCSSVHEVSDLTGDHVQRERVWTSCFTLEHSWLSGGPVRNSTASRYRQWLTHKLASWIDQFGVSGCVGCGRCITWCPVGIDITEEVAAIRETPSC